MSTTAIFAEILIIGLQASIWLGLLACAIWPELRGALWRVVGNNEILLGAFALAAVYTLGIVLDRVSDSVQGWIRKRFKKKPSARRKNRGLPKFHVMRLRVMGAEGRAAFIEYQRHRLRIARATTINLGLGVVAGGAFLLRGSFSDSPWLGDWPAVVWISLLAAVGLLAASSFAAERIDKAHANRLGDAYEMWQEDRERSDAPGAIVSAVCHRRANGGVEILLVRTKGGRHWTFPKGHVKPGEGPLVAAAREAREEAGVTGQVDADPVGLYLYPGSSDAPERDTAVTAYLLEVTKAGPPKEAERRPTWCSPPEARRLLAEGREERFAREHDHIVTAALARLARTSRQGP